MLMMLFPTLSLQEVLQLRQCHQGYRKKSWCGRDRNEKITTKKWIILAITSNHTEDLTGVIAVAFIQMYPSAC